MSKHIFTGTTLSRYSFILKFKKPRMIYISLFGFDTVQLLLAKCGWITNSTSSPHLVLQWWQGDGLFAARRRKGGDDEGWQKEGTKEGGRKEEKEEEEERKDGLHQDRKEMETHMYPNWKKSKVYLDSQVRFFISCASFSISCLWHMVISEMNLEAFSFRGPLLFLPSVLSFLDWLT